MFLSRPISSDVGYRAARVAQVIAIISLPLSHLSGILFPMQQLKRFHKPHIRKFGDVHQLTTEMAGGSQGQETQGTGYDIT